jgi:hypothetical protein
MKQRLAPSSLLNSPDKHSLQSLSFDSSASDTLKILSLYFPAEHFLQAICPFSSLYIPNPHKKHASASDLLLNCPSKQFVQEAADCRSGLPKYPRGQILHLISIPAVS